MKIIFVNRPVQDDNTTIGEVQLIDGEIRSWSVNTMKMRGTFKEWVEQIKYKIDNHSNFKNIKGVYVYDLIISPEIKEDGFCPTRGIMIRFDYIK